MLGASLGDVSYHVKQLWEMGVVELVETRPVRGAVEHFYRVVHRPILSDEEARELSPEERLYFARQISLLAFADATLALEEKF